MEDTVSLSSEIRKKIKQIEIHTRRLLRGSQVGDSRSAIKGTGFEFDQIRDYQLGDDVRFIDWKATSRTNSLLVKQYIEERSRTIMLALDVSGSSQFGSQYNLKRDTMAQVASILALVAHMGKDRVGLILFSDVIEAYIPPARGYNHIQQLMIKAFSFKARRNKTNITTILKKYAELTYKDMVGFIISDFIDDQIDPAYLSPVAKKYEIVGIRCLDHHEQTLPAIGFISMQDRETGEEILVDLRSPTSIATFLHNRIAEQNKLCKRHGMHMLDIANHDDFVGDLIKFFRRRMRY